MGEITFQTWTRKLKANHGLTQDKIWNVPWAKRCNFYSYDGRKDVTLRNRISEILTKSRKPPKVEDFVSSLGLESQVSSLGPESRSRVSVRSLGPESRSESVPARMSMSMVSDSSGRPCLHEVEVFGAKIYID